MLAGIAASLVVMLFDHDGRPQVLWSPAVAAVAPAPPPSPRAMAR